jgi:hypothetical protein
MNFAKKSLSVLLFVAAAALAGSAQDINARFKLESPTRFGSTILPAGTYRILRVSYTQPVVTLTPLSGGVGSVMLVARVKEYNTPCARTSLYAVREDGQWTATSICLSESATTLSFGSAPKSAPVTTAALAGK